MWLLYYTSTRYIHVFSPFQLPHLVNCFKRPSPCNGLLEVFAVFFFVDAVTVLVFPTLAINKVSFLATYRWLIFFLQVFHWLIFFSALTTSKFSSRAFHWFNVFPCLGLLIFFPACRVAFPAPVIGRLFLPAFTIDFLALTTCLLFTRVCHWLIFLAHLLLVYLFSPPLFTG